ncbi:MAG TPA: type II secretion system protein GspM, partial [Sphingomonas sp.]
TRSLRERRLLIVMVALLVLVILWAGIIRPVGDGLSSARGRHADAVVRLGETQTAVDAIRGAGRRPPIAGSVADAVRARADQAGFTLANLTEDGPNRVRVAIQAARPAALTGWLAGLEARGLLVEQATMTDNGDRTVAAQLVIEGRRS